MQSRKLVACSLIFLLPFILFLIGQASPAFGQAASPLRRAGQGQQMQSPQQAQPQQDMQFQQQSQPQNFQQQQFQNQPFQQQSGQQFQQTQQFQQQPFQTQPSQQQPSQQWPDQQQFPGNQQFPSGQFPQPSDQQQVPQTYPDQQSQQPTQPQQPQQFQPLPPQQSPLQSPQGSQPAAVQTPGGPAPGNWRPTPKSPLSTGFCAVKISTDRSTIHLIDTTTGTERKHVSLGQDRVQKVFSSPDGAWSVAIFKVRGAAQYGALAVDLGKCEEQDAAELPAVVSSASFEGEEVVLKLEKKGEHRLKLRNRNLP